MELPIECTVKDTSVTFVVNNTIYDKDVVYATCYRFIDTMYVFLDQNDAGKWTATLTPKELNEDVQTQLRNCVGEFNNELLNVAFRKDIAHKNKAIREMLVSQALFAANPEEMDRLVVGLDEDFDLENDLGEDPYEITKSWEEKYGTDRALKKENDPVEIEE